MGLKCKELLVCVPIQIAELGIFMPYKVLQSDMFSVNVCAILSIKKRFNSIKVLLKHLPDDSNFLLTAFKLSLLKLCLGLGIWAYISQMEIK